MSDDHICTHHGSHKVRLLHLEQGQTRMRTKQDETEKRLDALTVAHARITAKIVGVMGVAQILLQIALKFVGH